METHQSYCDEAWMDRNAIRQEQHTVVSSFWIEFNLQSEGVISPISYKSSFNKPTLVPYIHPFFRALFIFSFNCHFFFLFQYPYLFVFVYSSHIIPLSVDAFAFPLNIRFSLPVVQSSF